MVIMHSIELLFSPTLMPFYLEADVLFAGLEAQGFVALCLSVLTALSF